MSGDRRGVFSPCWDVPVDRRVLEDEEGCLARYVRELCGGGGCVGSYDLVSRGNDEGEGRRDVEGRYELLDSDKERGKRRYCTGFLRSAP